MPVPRILVVEDDPVNLMVITRMLNRLGHQPDVARNGVEAVQAAALGDYDIIFMDLMMPELDGIQAARRIRNGEKGRDPMIFAVTANVLPEDRDACFAAGMDDYITKPIGLDAIRSLIESGTNGEPGTTPAVDLRRLTELRETMGDPEFFAELVTEFVQNSQELIEEIERGVTKGDLIVAGRAAHSLKSTSATFGGMEMSRQAAAAEDSLRRGARVDLPAMLGSLRSERERLCRILETGQA